MCKSVLVAGVAALSLALGASAQTARLDVQVSPDNTNWTDSLYAPAGTFVYVRVVASTTAPSAQGLASLVFQPTLTGWTGADTRMTFSSSTGAPVPINNGVPVNLGRMTPYGATGMSTSSASGLLTSINDSGTLRFAGARATTMTTDLAFGVNCNQNPRPSYPTYNTSNTCVVFKYGVQLSANPALRTMTADIPLAGIKGGKITWYGSQITSTGSPFDSLLTQANIDPAVISVGPPNMAPVAVADSYNMLENNTLFVTTGGVLANDTDPDAGDTKAAELISGATHGVLDFHPDGTFSYIPQTDYFGLDSFSYRVRDRVGAGSNAAVASIHIANVNHQPTFNANDPAIITEDSGSKSISSWATFSPGPNENSQAVLSYETMDVGNPGLFTLLGQPTVGPDGTLRYTPAPNMYGNSTFMVRVRDNGGTENGGSDLSDPREFTITIAAVNDAPTLSVAAVPSVLEDAGQQSIPAFAGFNPGPNEGDQVLLGYGVSAVSNPALFTTAPTVAPDGTLVFTPAPNASGASTFVLTARDSGGTAGGGVDTSAPQVVAITILSVNDAPTFAASNPPAVLEGASPQSISNWAAFNAGGGPFESSQTVSAYIVSGVSNPALFASGPSITNTGTLAYSLAADASGSSTFTVQVRDSGGTLNGGADTSPPQIFTLNVAPVNDAPSFAAPAITTALEDSGPVTLANWASFNPGPGESAQAVLAYTVSNLTNSGLFAATPTVGEDGTLRFTPAANAGGTTTFQLRVRDNGGTTGGGVDLSAPQTLTINITAVNDAPTVTAALIPTILEDSGAQTVANFATFNAGPNESGQSLLGYTVSALSSPGMFSAAPTVSNTGTLTYTAAPNASGTVTFLLQARDNGGTANGGSDTSIALQATLTITAVNDAPTFAAAAPSVTNEDAGQVAVANWASFNPGPGEADQSVLAYTVLVTSNPGLFAAAPAVAADGTLTYTAAANAGGSANIQVRVRDNGGTASGGVDTSAPQSFTITVNPVNDAPTVTLGSIPTIVEDGGAQSVTGFASTSFGPGESSQSLLGYTISSISNPAMFSSLPAVSNAGTLTYAPSLNASGTVTFTVQARDNGGTANGGVDTSIPVTATINITNVNDAPAFAASTPPASLEDAGPVTVAGWSTFNPGPFEDAQVASYEVTAVGTPSLFSATPVVSPAGVLSYTAAPNGSGTSTFTVRVRDNGGTASGGVDVSPTQTFMITVGPVNDAPTLNLSVIPTIQEDSSTQTVPGFAHFSPGPGETGQAVAEYLVSEVSNPAAFSMGPVIGDTGVLFYTPSPNASGTITFKVKVRDNGGTASGGVDTSAPVTATLTINGVNDAPIAIAHDVLIDARTVCGSLTLAPAQIDNGSYDPDNGPSELTFRINHTGEFRVGITPVVLTVTDPDGLFSTAAANVVVLAADANHNGVPDTCDLIRNGTGPGPDCNGDGNNSESQCVWDNGAASPAQSTTNGQLSQYGGNISARVADDFYLAPGLLYRITSFRGAILTNSIERTARLQFFRDCDGRPVGEPFASFESQVVAGQSQRDDDKFLVTYVFEFCDEKFVLDGGQTYWVSLQGKVNCNNTDQAYWAIVGSQADPTAMLGSVPYKALGIDGGHPCTINGYEEWESIADCCIGCASMSYMLTGDFCQLVWDNGPVDLGPTRGGDPSGINRGVFSRAADNLVIKPCRTETVCWIEAYIWTNCTPVNGWLEVYDNACQLPTGAPLHRILPTETIELAERIIIDGVEYRLVKLEFWNIPWTLVGGRNYWVSVGADGTNSFTARSFFAYADPHSPCGCRDRQLTFGAKMANQQADSRWFRGTHEYAFRVATKPFFTDTVYTNVPVGRSCPQDFNEDGFVTVQDLLSFMQAYFSSCP